MNVTKKLLNSDISVEDELQLSTKIAEECGLKPENIIFVFKLLSPTIPPFVLTA